MSESPNNKDSSLLQLTSVRFKEFYREPEAIFWTFVFPLLMAAGLGLAFRNRPPEAVKIAATEPSIARALQADKELSVQQMSPAAADHALRTGQVVLIATPSSNGVTYKYDEMNPDGRGARLLVDRAMQKSSGVPPAVNARDELVSEPGSRYIDFVVPGLLGMNLMGSGIWSLGFSIVDARRKKLLKRLIASPMPRWQYLLSFLMSRLVMLVFEVAALLLFAVFVFNVPIRAPLWELATLCLLGSLTFSAVGLLISSRAKTIEAASGLMNLIMLPMWILSGVFFPANRFPDLLQPFIRALPLTAVNDALRSSMLQGIHIHELNWQLAVISTWLVVSFFVALRIFRWR